MGSMTFLLPLLAVLLIAYVAEAAPGGAGGDTRCPPAEKIYSYSKKEECHSHSQCKGGKVCCVTPSRLKACVEPAFGSQKYDKYSSSSFSKTTATGTYCGNVKCSPYEKCVNERGRYMCRRS